MGKTSVKGWVRVKFDYICNSGSVLCWINVRTETQTETVNTTKQLPPTQRPMPNRRHTQHRAHSSHNHDAWATCERPSTTCAANCISANKEISVCPTHLRGSSTYSDLPGSNSLNPDQYGILAHPQPKQSPRWQPATPMFCFLCLSCQPDILNLSLGDWFKSRYRAFSSCSTFSQSVHPRNHSFCHLKCKLLIKNSGSGPK